MSIRRKFLWALGGTLATALWFPIRPAVVVGRSMEPTLHSGQVILVSRDDGGHLNLQRGDVVVFRHDDMVQVKRIYALPGDQVWEIRYAESDVVFLADRNSLPAVRHMTARTGEHTTLVERTIPPGMLYVLGDGGNASYDSRHYGPVPRAAVLGRVHLRDTTGQAMQDAIARATLQVGRTSNTLLTN